MLFRATKRLNIRDVRIALASAGAMAALLALHAGDPLAVRAVAMMAGALIATLVYEPLARVTDPSPAVLRVADFALVGQIAAMFGMLWRGDSLAATATADFFVFGIVFALLVVRDWVRGLINDPA